MNSLVSVITPVYNNEKYLEASVRSILMQSYKDWELILIDDGSTDLSGSICDRLEEEYESIHVIHQKNQGVSAARNVGLDHAQGDYIVFLDADDLLESDVLALFMKHVNKTNIVSVSWKPFVDGEEDKLVPAREDTVLRLEQKEAIEALFYEERFGYQGILCGKIFNKSILDHNHIRFSREIKYNEDRLFIMEYILCASQYIISYESSSYYRQNEEGAMGRSRRSYFSAVLTELDAFEKMKEIVDRKYPEIGDYIAKLTFEKALYWYKRVPRTIPEDRKKSRSIVRTNASRCTRSKDLTVLQKTKILLHGILLK